MTPLSWTSPGVATKPPGCALCPMYTLGIGFVPDEVLGQPEIGFLLEAPGETESIERRPLMGRSGQHWERAYLVPFGKDRSNVLIANTLRCRLEGNIYPLGHDRKIAELHCRRWDAYQGGDLGKPVPGGLTAFAPNLFIATYHPAAVLRGAAKEDHIRAHVGKAFRFAEMGYRPLVLMGDKAINLIRPQFAQLKKWAGHWWEGSL